MNNQAIKSVDAIATYAKSRNIAHLSTSNRPFSSNLIQVNNEEIVSFGSCSYLGLEFHESLKNGSIEAIQSFGTQFSSSRAYVSLGLYDILERKLSELFEAHVVVSPTTTLGHISTIPVLVGKNDLVILDHQVHNSVQTAVQLLKASNVRVELLRHNRMDLLEEKILKNVNDYDNIWYMADGIYSMYGDKTPLKEVFSLLDKFPTLRFYVDDAHAMSCYGKKGRGYILGEREIHKQMIVATSLNKAFASGGGALIFPNESLAQKVKNCGGPMITSGPMQPGALGAAVASADLHLSGEVEIYQKELHDKLEYAHELLAEYALPNLAERDSPIFFIAVGLPKIGYKIVDRMKDMGSYLNLGIFPAVPMKNTGVRFTITRLHSFVQIEKMIRDLATVYFDVLEEEDYSLELICKAFKIDPIKYMKTEEIIESKTEKFSINTYCSALDIDKEVWNSNLGHRGVFDWNGLLVMENAFTGNTKPEENFEFRYINILDEQGKVVLQTLLSIGLVKDDILADSDTSMDIEKCRESDEYFYTSKSITVGTPISEGNHLFIDKSSSNWKGALRILFEIIEKIQIEMDVSTLLIRDLQTDSSEMDDLMLDNGYFKIDLPTNYRLNIAEWDLSESFKTTLSKRSKRHFKENVERTMDLFNVTIYDRVDSTRLDQYYELYENVQSKSLSINTFKLPIKLFTEINSNSQWEFVELKVSDEIVAVVVAYKGITTYTPTLIGLNYKANKLYNSYRQAIFQIIKRAKELDYEEICFGYSTGIEKRKFGAKEIDSVAYMQLKDNFKLESLITDSRMEVESVKV